MIWQAACLALTGAFFNATWNLLFKKSDGGLPFVCLVGLLSMVLYSPAALWAVWSAGAQIGPLQLVLLFGCAALHLTYYLLLGRGYRLGDLSLIYPLVRGTGPLFCTLGAVLLLGEQPTGPMIAGTALIVAGILLICGQTLRQADARIRQSLYCVVLCGCVIAVYTVLDKAILSQFFLPPLFMAWFSEFGRSVLLAPYVMRRRALLRDQWQKNRRLVIGVAILNPLGYIFILFALSLSSVSFVAPLREFSILIGVLFGSRLLAEGQLLLRLAGALAMMAGFVSITMG